MMEKILGALNYVKILFLRAIEAGLALTGVIVVVYLLLGEGSGPYVVSVVTNLSLFVSAVSSEAILGLAILVGLFFFIRKKI
jgi:hypothetical protein